MSTIASPNAKLDFIDSLRGIAIIMVVIVHVGDKLANISKGMLLLSDYGQFGVQLFFVVSAFTLCLTMDKRKGEARPITKFYIRRYFRIAPLYYFGIFLYLCYHSFRPLIAGGAAAYDSRYTFKNILANLLLINDSTPGVANNGIVPGGWSIGTETTFYVLFPLLILIYKRLNKSVLALILIPIVGLAISFLSLYALEFFFISVNKSDFWTYIKDGTFLYYSMVCQLPVFLLGMSLYYILLKYRGISKTGTYISAVGFMGLLFISAFLLVYFKSYIYLLPFTAGLSFVFLFILYKEVPLLTNTLLSRIGQLSYSIYLFHFLFVWEGTPFLYNQLHPYLGSNLIFIISTIVALGLASGLALLSEKYIENPGIGLGRKLTKRLKTSHSIKHPKEALKQQSYY